MPTSVRLDSGTKQALDHLARSQSKTKSEIVREAIELLAHQEARRPYEKVSDLIGCVTGGPTNLSENTGRELRRLLVLRKQP